MAIDGQGGALPLGPRCARRRHRHGASGAVDRLRPDGRRERLSRQAAGQRARHGRLGRHGRRRRGAARRSRHRRRPEDAHGRAADRPAAADRARPRAVLRAPASSSSTSRPRRCRRPRWSGCSTCCAACARAGAASSSSRISSTTSCRSPTPSRSSATAGASSPRAPPRSTRRWVIERMIGLGHEELEESYTGAIELDSKPDAPVVLAARSLGLGRAYADVSLDVRAGEVLGIYGFMGCGQLELARTLFGKIRAKRGTLSIDGRPVTARQHRGGQARRHRLRAGEPPLDAVPPRAGLQEHLDLDPRAHLAALAASPPPSARSPQTPGREPQHPPAPRRGACSARSRAATSRRWRWPSG